MTDANGTPPLAVVHLALGSFGLDPFRAFVESYRAHDPGRPHGLIIALKQVAESDAGPYRSILEGIPHRLMFVPDSGYDLGTYFLVARETGYRDYCFLNSRSVLLADQWLDKLARAAAESNVAIVGATGSLESISTNALHNVGVVSNWPRPLMPLRGLLGFLKLVRRFPPFPNPHIRTNAFLVSRSRLLAVDEPAIRDKYDAWLFESGRRGLTRQIVGRGERALLVNAHGERFDIADWKRSDTFWQGAQAGLLVADKQTDYYRDATPDSRRALQRNAWGA